MPNIIVADEQVVARKGLGLILRSSLRDLTLHFSETFQETIQLLDSQEVDLLIFDICIPKENSIKVISTLRKSNPAVKILIFSNADEKINAIRYIQAGANGFLQKNASEATILSAVNNLLKFGVYVSEGMRDSVYRFAVKRETYNPLESLSDREFEVAKLLIRGMGNIEIMNELNIKMSTVSTYKNRIFEKLEINNIVSLFEIFRIYEEFNQY